MLKKRLGIEGIERDWPIGVNLKDCFKVPSPLIIPKDCVGIGYGAFANCTNLKEVIISEGCERIGVSAFGGCIRLEEVSVSRSVRKIGKAAFYLCECATIILEKPWSEFKIGDNAFYGVRDVKEEVRN